MAADDDVQRYFDQLPFKLKRQLATAIKAEADRVASAIRAEAPRDTGALAESVQVRRRRDELELEVVAGGDLTTKEVRNGSGVSYDYALAIEFGATDRPAEPFFYPTWRAMREDVQSNIETAIAEVLK